MDGPVARRDLKFIDAYARDETVQIEHRHGMMRRFVLSRSIQRRVVDLSSLNVFWLNRQLHDLKDGLWGDGSSVAGDECAGGDRDVEQEKGEDNEKGTDKKRRQLSTWDRYRGERTQGLLGRDRPTYAETSEGYNNLSEESTETLFKRRQEAIDARDA